MAVKSNSIDKKNTTLVIRLPDQWVLKISMKCMYFALILVSFLIFRPNFAGNIHDSNLQTTGYGGDEPKNANFLLLGFMRDLKEEGLLKKGDKALFVSYNNNDDEEMDSILPENDVVKVSATDLQRQSSISDESFDFVFAKGFVSEKEFVDRATKAGGVVAIEFEKNSLGFDKPLNYQVIYVRHFEHSTVMAMKKTETTKASSETMPAAGRRLLGYGIEAKKAALKKLEDVLLEPPRASSGKSRRYIKRTKYLPDLLGDSLESYSRRVFIDVGLPKRDGGGGGTSWFIKNYPSRNLPFEMYSVETVAEDAVPAIGMSDWMRVSVTEEEFVVMKAEAEVVEEMMKSKTISLVDELFLECKPDGVGVGRKNMRNGSRRAYWECLALYGKLRDEGVAVHQWWS